MIDREPDLEIAAALRADEVRFECKPQVRVAVYSDAPTSAEIVSERENLPDTLEPGVTYRDFSVRWRATAYLADPQSPYWELGPAEEK
jgi:hypothetical protein